MLEKIKAFFAKKAVIVTEGVIIAICAVGLFFGGVNATEYTAKVVEATLACVAGVIALVKIIVGLVGKSE